MTETATQTVAVEEPPRYMIEDVLVAQKSRILDTIGEGRHERAMAQLSVLIDLWIVADYAYKGRHVAQCIVDGIDNEMRPLRPTTKRWKALAELRYTAQGQLLAFME